MSVSIYAKTQRCLAVIRRRGIPTSLQKYQDQFETHIIHTLRHYDNLWRRFSQEILMATKIKQSDYPEKTAIYPRSSPLWTFRNNQLLPPIFMLVHVITCSFYVFPMKMLFSSLRQIDYVCSPFFSSGTTQSEIQGFLSRFVPPFKHSSIFSLC